MDTKDIGLTESLDAFITTTGEKPIIKTRQHWLTVFYSLLVTFFLSIILLISNFLFFVVFIRSNLLFLFSFLIIILTTINLVVKQFIEWYFSFYIITTRKIIDCSYAPLFSHVLNEIILDQVRCTEIDVKINGFINEIFDIGDILITFDRPTHQEAFVISNIHNPKKIGIFLGDFFDIIKKSTNVTNDEKMQWYKLRNRIGGFGFIEEINPPRNIVLT